MYSRIKTLIGGKTPAQRIHASLVNPPDTTGIQPPLLTEIFGRPTSEFTTPLSYGLPPERPPPERPPPTESASLPAQRPLTSIPEHAAPSPEPQRQYTPNWPEYDTNHTYQTNYADAVSIFDPEAQHPKSSVQGQERGEAPTGGVGNAIRPPTERALKMQSLDVTGWTERIRDTEGSADTEKMVVPMPNTALGNPIPSQTLQRLKAAESPPVRIGYAIIPKWKEPSANTSRGASSEPKGGDADTHSTTISATRLVIPPQVEAMTEKDLDKPTCSLNLICYRPGSQGCILRQIRVIDKKRFEALNDYHQTLKLNPGIIETDHDFFDAIRTEYTKNMCSFWRRKFSLKTLRQIRLLSVCRFSYLRTQYMHRLTHD
jgi:hypothetical protein